jgi:phage terminase large subunit
MDSGKKRAVIVWHRRAGKDKTLLNLTIKKMVERVGSYYYFFPTYSQGKKILWDGVDKDGFKFLDHFPKELVDGKPNDTELKVKLKNGSLFQIIGTDNYNSIVGTNPVGCVFSEYSLQDPIAWDYMRPILAENGGWAVFNFTPRGKNHGYKLYEAAKNDPAWFSQLLTVDDTNVISPEVLEQERKEIIEKNGDDSIFQQEYYCSFNASIQGAYYANQLDKARVDGRIKLVPHDPLLKVHTWWDLGVGDSTAIGFFQTYGNEWRMIDYYEASGEGLQHYINVLNQKGYQYGDHYAPHDIRVRELGSGKSRLEIAQELGLEYSIAPNMTIDDGINAVRMRFNTLWIDQDKCKRFLEAISQYRKEWNDKMGEYKPHPLHDWTSHAADMLRYWAVTNFEPDMSFARMRELQATRERKAQNYAR